MELLFAYDDKVACDADGNLYTGSTFSQSVFDRYLQFFSHITLLARHAPADTDCAKWNRLDYERVSVVFLSNRRSSVKSILSLHENHAFQNEVRRQITPERAVICRVPSTAGAVAAAYCRRIGKPFLIEIVGCPWDSYRNHSFAGKLLAPFEWAMQRRAVRRAPFALYVTHTFLQRRYPCFGICAAISDVELRETDDIVLVKRIEKIRQHNGKLKIGTAAAVDVAYKGQQYVIEALAKLKEQGRTDFEYHLVGGGNQAMLRTLAEKLGVAEQVVFEGSLPHEQIFAWLDGLELYIQPSLQEGLPRAVIEAMSRGLPALGAHTGGIPELLGGDCIFPQRDSSSIAEQLFSITEERLTNMARENFIHAQAFEHQKLEKMRNQFYSAFLAEL